MKASYVYIMTNQRKGTLYVGTTTDLVKRVWEHKAKLLLVSLKSMIAISLFTMKFMSPFWTLHDVRDVLRIGVGSGKLI